MAPMGVLDPDFWGEAGPEVVAAGVALAATAGVEPPPPEGMLTDASPSPAAGIVVFASASRVCDLDI